MDNSNLKEMTEEHVKILKSYGYWGHIATNRCKLLQQDLEVFNVKK